MDERKAMSPLIATVLLIAFVVAFTALIVSAINMLAGGRQACDKAAISMGQEEAPTVCLDEATGQLHMAIKNTGSAAIAGFAVTAAGEIATVDEEVAATLNKDASDEYTVSYPAANGALKEFTIVPLLGKEEKEACSGSAITVAGEKIPRC